MVAGAFYPFGLLLLLLVSAVVSDLRHHRIPNFLILLGLVLGLVGQVYAFGLWGAGASLLGVLVGFGVFLPLYALGGMAAGDVKLMAMVGGFLGAEGALFASLYSLVVGGLCGLLLMMVHGQLLQTLGRYWLILLARAYMKPAPNEIAGKPFPYSIAILLGTLTSGYFMFTSAGV